MATFYQKFAEQTFSGSGDINKYSLFSTLNNNVRANIPKHSTVSKALWKYSVSETSNKLGNADLDIYLTDSSYAPDLNLSPIYLYQGNGVIPKGGSGYATGTADVTNYVAKSGASVGEISCSGKDRITANITSSLLSRDYKGYLEYEWTYTPPTYTIKTVAGTGGKVTDTATYDVTIANQTKQITATPNTGYKFVKWTDSNGDTYTDETISVTISQDSISAHSTTVTYTAEFAPITYTVKFVNYDGTVLQSSSVSHGSTPSYTGTTPTKPATAQYTYTFSGWSPTIATATANATYTAQFTATTNKYKITTAVSPTGGGTVTGGGTYNYGTKPTLTATPATGYKFVKWSDGVTTASRTVTVTGDATYTAYFESNSNIYRGKKQQVFYRAKRRIQVYRGNNKVCE